MKIVELDKPSELQENEKNEEKPKKTRKKLPKTAKEEWVDMFRVDTTQILKKLGRPSKYDEKYCKMLIKHASEGKSFQSFSIKIGVNLDTLYEWVKTHKIFSETYCEARRLAEEYWTKMGEIGATGGIPDFNSSVWKFFMINRFKNNWRNVQDVQHSGPDGGPIQTQTSQDFSKMTDEQLDIEFNKRRKGGK